MRQGLNEILSLMQRTGGYILTEEILVEATRDEIYNVYYHEQNGKTKKIPKELFDRFCELGDVDNNPNKMSEFAKWLCDIFRTPKYDGYYIYTYPNLKQDFLTFRKLQKIKPQGVDLNLRNYDLNEFTEVMDQARKLSLDVSQQDIKRSGVEIFFKNQEWQVVWLKTYEASKFYGKGTKWCTASNDFDDHFNGYNRRGLLIVFINLNTGDKYQIHVRGNYPENDGICDQMDASDEPVDIREIVPPQVLQVVLNKAHEKLEIRVEDRWKSESSMAEKITEDIEIWTIGGEAYRLYNNKTNEYVIINNVKTYQEYSFYKNWGILRLEEKYGERNIVLLINGNNYSILGDYIKVFYNISEGWMDAGGYEEPLFFMRKGGYECLFDARTRSYATFSGIDKFAMIRHSRQLLILKTLDNEAMIFNREKNEIVRLDGKERFKKIVNTGRGVYMIYDNEDNRYLYHRKRGLIFSSPDIVDVEEIQGANFIITLDAGDEDYRYKVYNYDENEFITINGIDMFEGFGKVAYDRLLILYIYEPKLQAYAYNTTRCRVSKSTIIPMQNTEMEAFYDDSILFWGDNELLYYFDLVKNLTFELPVEIKKEKIAFHQGNNGDRCTIVCRLETKDNIEYTFLLVRGKETLLVSSPDKEKETFRL